MKKVSKSIVEETQRAIPNTLTEYKEKVERSENQTLNSLKM